VLNNVTLEDAHEEVYEEANNTFVAIFQSPSFCKGALNLPLVTYTSLCGLKGLYPNPHPYHAIQFQSLPTNNPRKCGYAFITLNNL
jgi:hypothetical protein